MLAAAPVARAAGRYRPEFLGYTMRACDGAHIDPALHRFEGMPT